MDENEVKRSSGSVFPVGLPVHPAFRQYYSGDCYEASLAGYENPTGCTAANVTFAPGCRNDWHTHPGGQLLLVHAGRGWYQEEDQPPQELHPGDVVRIPPGARHWHGAAKDSWYSHIAIKEISTAGMPQWFGPVSQEEYDRLI